MKLEELQDKLDGVYDFTKVVDCQTIIRMLLRDLENQATLLDGKLRVLAKLVMDNSPTSKSEANKILNGVQQKVDVMAFLGRMSGNMDRVEKMTDQQLHDEGTRIWADYDMDSNESSVLGELLRRFEKGKG